MPRPYVLHRLTAVALVAVAGLLVIAYGVRPTPTTQYGAWLTVFAIWMWWFVAVARRWLDDADL